jgi:hypothetical protein
VAEYVITAVHCGYCNAPLDYQNWVYRDGLKLLCPQCGRLSDSPWRDNSGKEACIKCGAPPDFATGSHPNRPEYLCRACVLAKAESALEGTSSTDSSASEYVIGGALGVVIGLGLVGLTVKLALEPEPTVWPLFWGFWAIMLLAVGIRFIFRRDVLAEDASQRAAHARALKARLEGVQGVEARLAVFGLAPGDPLPFTHDYVGNAPA